MKILTSACENNSKTGDAGDVLVSLKHDQPLYCKISRREGLKLKVVSHGSSFGAMKSLGISSIVQGADIESIFLEVLF